jgi:hypothetical protein
MAISPKYLGGLILTNSDQDIVISGSGETTRITSIIVSNGSTGGTFTLKFYDSSNTATRILENATVLSANERYVFSQQIYLEENDKLIASAGTTTDAQISVFGLVTPSVTSDRSGHIVKNEGTPLTQRTGLNFVGSLVTATDDAGNNETDVTINFSSTEITGKTTVTAESGDFVLISDTSDTGNLKKVDVIDFFSSISSADITGKTLVTVAPTDNLLITDASDANNLKKIIASDFLLSASATLVGNLNVSSFSIVDTNSNELLNFGVTASAVNEITITNNSATNNPKISATGGDTNIGLTLEGKGTGQIRIESPILFNKPQTIKGTEVTGSSVDCSVDNFFWKNVNGNVTFTFDNPPSTGYFQFVLHINYTSGTVQYPTVTWLNGTASPTLSAGSFAIPFYTYDGGTTWYGGGQ